MRGRSLMIGLLVFTAVFAAALWYALNYAYFEQFTVNQVEIAGELYDVSNFEGIDATSSPLHLRACFRLSRPVEAPIAEMPTPLVGPGWFECFDAEAIDNALESGAAVAYLAAAETAAGVDRIVAVYPDGRAFMWRQLNEKFRE